MARRSTHPASARKLFATPRSNRKKNCPVAPPQQLSDRGDSARPPGVNNRASQLRGFRFLSQSPFSGVHDPKLDALILGGQALVNPAARDKTYQQAAQYIAKNADGPFLFPLASWNVAVHGVQGPGLTTSIPSVVVNTAPLWQDVSFTQ